jgi:Sel1 repeat
MIRYIYAVMTFLICVQTNTLFGQTKRIKDDLKRAIKFDESKRMDTYHVYEKYLTNEQRFELNMYYVNQHVKIPNENEKNFWLRKSAIDGNTCAQINLAYSYKIGRVVKKDSNNCRKWLLNAIKEYSDLANYYYGLCCLDNSFTKKVCDSAIYYLKEADNRKIEDASLALACAYKYGIQTEKNETEANNYFSKFKDYNNSKGTELKLTNIILLPNGFNYTNLLNTQLYKSITALNTDSQLVVTIKTNGNSSYLTQQLSWDKANSIRLYLNSKGINNERICICYGGQYNNSLVEIVISKRDNKFVNIFPPPPVPNYQKTIFLGCENTY